MKSLYRIFAVAGLASLAASGIAWAQDDALVAKAKSQGTVSIYTSTDLAEAQAMVDAFKKKYPGIKVDYNDLGTNGVYNKVLSEAAAQQVTADVVWSSAMDLQMKLAQGGHFQKVDVPEKKDIPGWADYKEILYATSIEPVGMIVNTNELAAGKAPKTRADLLTFLKSSAAKGKVASFDPAKSGFGFLIDTVEVKTVPNFWDIAKAFGAAKGKQYSSSGAMKETVVSGENVLAFNVIGSYALNWIKQSKNLGVSFPQENTVAFSRLIALTKGAPHPDAGKLFIEFVLSKEGQSELAKKGLPSVRKDVDAGFNIDTINKRVGGHIKPIPVDEGLLAYLDPMKRAEFLKKWNSATR